MRLLMIGDGRERIPPVGRGAIQTIIWDYATRLRERGHEVEILNVRASRLPYCAELALRGRGYDWVWTHHDRSVPWVRRYAGGRHVHLSHRPVTDPEHLDAFDAGQLRRASGAPHHLCLTRDAMLLNKVLNPPSRVAFAPNGVAVEAFRFAPEGRGAICLGALSRRKRQREVFDAGVACDFVGPLDDRDDALLELARGPAYLGAWTREEIRERLTGYAALVLFSAAEAQPLVVAEAFAAGLSVVLSPQAAENVDRSLPFVTVIERASELAGAVARAGATNPLHRAAIRAHALAHWDWASRVEAVETTLEAWRRQRSGRPSRA